MKHFLFSLLLLTIYSCNSSKENNYHISERISTDIDSLSKFLNFKKFKPSEVKFKLTYIDNSSKARIDVPGPSDYTLEAILYFNKETFESIKNFQKKSEVLNRNNKKDFEFEWLSDSIKEQFKKQEPGYFLISSDNLFNSGLNSNICLFDNKVLFHKETN